ncbi:hypothetical protein H8356DRAFT_1352055 [Neocallimastix lanati (nom. inval.)]|nr:hypothetical protein H8356DRAFT_1352055 [Neocallimastix sp. JGI-2020a]
MCTTPSFSPPSSGVMGILRQNCFYWTTLNFTSTTPPNAYPVRNFPLNFVLTPWFENEHNKNELNNQLETLIYQKDSDISLFIVELIYAIKIFLNWFTASLANNK